MNFLVIETKNNKRSRRANRETKIKLKKKRRKQNGKELDGV